jgi:zinc transport system ATP-binding protein
MKPPALEVEGLTVYYPGNNHPAVDDVTLSIDKGKIAVLIGPNGSGKTTLIKAILGLIGYEGKIRVFGEDVKNNYKKIGYVPQRFNFDLTFPITVYEFISLAVDGEKGIVKNKIKEILKTIDAEDLIDRKLSSLSGGQLQRALLARALIRNPELLVLDEPEAGIDVGGEQTFYDMVEKLVQIDNITALISSHELDIVYTYATDVICLNKKLFCLGSPRKVLNQDVFEKLYGRSLKFYGHAHKLVHKTHE